MDNLFDNGEGEDSGLEFEDSSAGGPPSDDLQAVQVNVCVF